MSTSCIDFPVVPSAPAGMRFGVLGEDDTGGEHRLFSTAFTVGIATPLFIAGDINTVGSGTILTVDDNAQMVFIRNTLGRALELDMANFQYQIGDIDQVNNGTELFIDDATGVQKTLIRDALGDTLSLDRFNDIYSIGDISGVTTGLRLEVDADNDRVRVFNTAGEYLFLDKGSDFYEIGDISNTLNGTRVSIDDSTQEITVRAVNGLHIEFDTTLIHSNTTLADGAGAATGTLTNAPTAGNPTKWIAIDDAGTIRYIPTWL